MSKKMCKKKDKVQIALSAIIGLMIVSFVTCIANRILRGKKNRTKKPEILPNSVNKEDRHVYFVGGGLGSLAGATYLIRDCNFKGENIHIIEGMKSIGGSNDASGDAISGYVSRGGRMLNEETYENFWELFSSIPSLEMKGKSVTEEILNFDHFHPVHAKARIIDKNGDIQDVSTMGFDNSDLMALGKLIITPNKKLEDKTIECWFKQTPHFFETNFWYMWQTTFAFQKWSSLTEFKRYLGRMIHEFPRIETLEGVTHTPFNQYESVILPIKSYLDGVGVKFCTNKTVTDLDFKIGNEITVTRIHLKEEIKEVDKQDLIQSDNKDNLPNESTIELKFGDVCIITNGCMTDCSTLGDMKTAPEPNTNKPIAGELWTKISNKKKGLGNPERFFGHPDKTNWESFTITCKGDKFIKLIEAFSTNIPGSGTLMSFKDSNWLMSIVVPAQPYFKTQPIDTTILWGYGLYTDKVGNFISKPMRDCTGEEILQELLYHLHMINDFNEILPTVINVIPCMLPYVGAQFQPRKTSDRPNVIPKGSTNFAMISQFVEIPNDMVFTEEYSIRAARIAIYSLFNVTDKKVCPVTPYKRNLRVLKKVLKTCLK